jgi:nucleotide-binding universal stress UspA family protein
VDETPVSLYAAKYFTDIFGDSPDVGVTLLWVSSGTDPDYFETTEEAREHERELQEKGETLLGRVKGILSGGGVDEGRIHLRVVAAEKKGKTSDKILEELETGEYDTIIIGKHPLTRSQEFLFGSAAVRLVREAPINVLSVKGAMEDNGIETNDSEVSEEKIWGAGGAQEKGNGLN